MLRELYSSPDIIGLTKSRGMKLAGHEENKGRKPEADSVLVGNPEENISLGANT
jgi:hypothetical protein